MFLNTPSINQKHRILFALNRFLRQIGQFVGFLRADAGSGRIDKELEMSSERYYVRIRGRIAGPFDLAQLRTMVDQGQLSRIHEVSGDKLNWASAGSLEVLFWPPSEPLVEIELLPGAASPPADATDEAATAEEDDGMIILPPLAASGESSRSEPVELKYYYAQGGAMVGPLPLSELRSLAASRQIRPEDLVWKEGDPEWVAAAQFEALASIFGAR